MLFALFRSIAALFTPALRRVVVVGLGLTLLSFVALWLAVAVALQHLAVFAWRPLDWLVDLLGAVSVLALSWLLFPAVATLVLGFFLDRVAAAVEAIDYPEMNPPRYQPLLEIVSVTLRLMGLAILLNLLSLPLYLLLPGINLLVFLTLNGYLLGRGYFEVVALRRLDAATVRVVRRRYGGRIFLGGLAIVGLFALPLVNLVAPVIATALMVHVFAGLPCAGIGVRRS